MNDPISMMNIALLLQDWGGQVEAIRKKQAEHDRQSLLKLLSEYESRSSSVKNEEIK